MDVSEEIPYFWTWAYISTAVVKGIGLKSVKTVVKQYHGMVNISEQEHVFSTQIMLGTLVN